MTKVGMDLSVATAAAREILQLLEPHCRRIMVVGSIRRQKPIVHDIDIVLIPANQGRLAIALRNLGEPAPSGPSIHACLYKRRYPVECYIATESTWWTLVLIRTGSKEHNIRLASLAQSKHWQLKADGQGLFDERGYLVAGDSEESFFRALGIPYKEPMKR